MGQTNAERKRAFRERQKAKGLKPRNIDMTDDEAFYVERMLRQMRSEGGVPAMMRNAKGQLKAFDA